MLGGGATFAVSTLIAPKPLVQEKELQELLTPPDYASQLKSILNTRMGMHLYRSDTSRASDTVESLFERLIIDDQEAAQFIRSNPQIRKQLLSKSGRPIRAEVDEHNRVLSLKVLWAQGDSNYNELELFRKPFTTENLTSVDELMISASTSSSNGENASANASASASTSASTNGNISFSTESGLNDRRSNTKLSAKLSTKAKAASAFEMQLQTHPMHTSVRVANGQIQTSLFAATDAARVPDPIAAQITELFAGEIDFHRNIQKGDRFTLLYEALDADGEPMGFGKIIGAEFVISGVSHQAMYFQPSGAKEGSYFNLNGQSLKRTYLAAPLKYSRITSGYKMRFHPILQTWKAHKGIDYAAPVGTPVHTVGKGVVKSTGWVNGLGNVVFVDHGNAQTTVYAHLSQISVKNAQQLEQGQVIGSVGESGWATGPHLHFEFRINDQYKDPSTIARQLGAVVLSASANAEFKQQASAMRIQLSRSASPEVDHLAIAQ